MLLPPPVWTDTRKIWSRWHVLPAGRVRKVTCSALCGCHICHSCIEFTPEDNRLWEIIGYLLILLLLLLLLTLKTVRSTVTVCTTRDLVWAPSLIQHIAFALCVLLHPGLRVFQPTKFNRDLPIFCRHCMCVCGFFFTAVTCKNFIRSVHIWSAFMWFYLVYTWCLFIFSCTLFISFTFTFTGTIYCVLDIVGTVYHLVTYVVGSKSFRPDIQKPRQMENAVRDI